MAVIPQQVSVPLDSGHPAIFHLQHRFGQSRSIGQRLDDRHRLRLRRVRNQVVGVAADDQIDPLHFGRQQLVHLFPLVRDDDHHLGLPAQFGDPVSGRLDAAGEAQPRDVVRFGGPVGVVIAEGEKTDSDSVDLDDLVGRAEERLARRFLEDIGATQRKLGHFRQLPGTLQAVIEVMVSERHEIVAEGIHQLDHRFAFGAIHQQVVAEGIAGMHQENPLGTPSLADRHDGFGQVGKSADHFGPLEGEGGCHPWIVTLRRGIGGTGGKGGVAAMEVAGRQDSNGGLRPPRSLLGSWEGRQGKGSQQNGTKDHWGDDSVHFRLLAVARGVKTSDLMGARMGSERGALDPNV